MKNETNTQQASHTPGPWRINEKSNLRIDNSKGEIICALLYATTEGQITPETEANAQLIARAPELLKENEQLKVRANKAVDKLNIELKRVIAAEALNDELLEALYQARFIATQQGVEKAFMTVVDTVDQRYCRAKEIIESAIAKAEGKNLPVS